jgi:hypothetical protein
MLHRCTEQCGMWLTHSEPRCYDCTAAAYRRAAPVPVRVPGLGDGIWMQTEPARPPREPWPVSRVAACGGKLTGLALVILAVLVLPLGPWVLTYALVPLGVFGAVLVSAWEQRGTS